ncbi:hypothetical protein [Chryseobacterium vrystaatense]|uniref:Uncharacterized protein n=1 Tax=Chryseobacterium vrystaatense TaxID=307480 RepID=A0A1M5DWI3_9FLAO|nr:hypothetical protein [Chryseobacterium vrystaatense]SHF71290.1 hypothetical protein SAMN02787073_2738 [Chryseobacterium vrystaatense]
MLRHEKKYIVKLNGSLTHAVLFFYNSLFLSPLYNIEYHVCYNGVYNPLRPLRLSEKHKFYYIHFGLVWAGSPGIGGISSFTVIKKTV